MSFFGKFLLVLNLLGAAALGYFAVQDYGKRQAWSQAAFTYDWMLDGLPVDGDQLDESGWPVADRMAESVNGHLFSGVGGQPVATQTDEVKRVKGLVDAKLAPVQADKVKHSHELAKLLLPLADFNLERDQYIAARTHLASDAAVAALRQRYNKALIEAKEILAREKKGAAPGDKERSSEDAFRLGFRLQAGLPSDAMTRLIADGLPANLAGLANTDALFDAALETQRAQFQAKLDGLFFAAQAGPKEPTNRKASLATQKAAIARLLFGLSVSLAGDDLTQKAVQDLQGQAMRRMYVVCGLRVGLDAVSERTAILRGLAMLADSAAAQERTVFLADLAYWLEAAREQAYLVLQEERAIIDSRAKVTAQQALVSKREADVKKAKEQFDDALLKTDEQLRALRKMSGELLADRVLARDKIGELLQKNEEIERLEKRIRELKQKKAR